MSTTPNPIVDALSPLADAASQRAAARLAQDIFGEVFRQALTPDAEQLGKALRALETRCIEWCEAGDSGDRQLLRLAMLINGLDQWGLAYTQAFELTAIPALSALIASLRGRLDAQSDTLFGQFFEAIEHGETNAVDFKVDLRRGIHLALWHAMLACDTVEEARSLVQHLGTMLLAVNQRLPEIGWRLVADALAHMQIALLDDAAAATPVARESTQLLFESLQHALPAPHYQTILRHSSHVVIAWQQARRPNTVH